MKLKNIFMIALKMLQFAFIISVLFALIIPAGAHSGNGTSKSNIPDSTLTGVADTSKTDKKTVNPYENADITYKIIDAPENTYGYEILIEGRKYIHQPNVPGLPGNTGFKTKANAEKTAWLVISKIRRNIMPPGVTMQELDSIKVLK